MAEKKISLASLSGTGEAEMSKRIKEGQEKARAQGRHIGRKKTRNSELIQALLKSGMSYRQIAAVANTSRGSVYNEKIQGEDQA